MWDGNHFPRNGLPSFRIGNLASRRFQTIYIQRLRNRAKGRVAFATAAGSIGAVVLSKLSILFPLFAEWPRRVAITRLKVGRSGGRANELSLDIKTLVINHSSVSSYFSLKLLYAVCIRYSISNRDFMINNRKWMSVSSASFFSLLFSLSFFFNKRSFVLPRLPASLFKIHHRNRVAVKMLHVASPRLAVRAMANGGDGGGRHLFSISRHCAATRILFSRHITSVRTSLELRRA